MKTKVPYNVLLGDTTNANNVSGKNSVVARLDLLVGGWQGQSGAPKARAARGVRGMHLLKILKYGVSEIAF